MPMCAMPTNSWNSSPPARSRQRRRDLCDTGEEPVRVLCLQRLGCAVTPGHGGKGDAGGPRRLAVAQLVADIDRLCRRHAKALYQPPQLRGLAEQRDAAGIVI